MGQTNKGGKGTGVSAIFTKLNLKEQKQILVVNAPESFESALAGLKGIEIHRRMEDLAEIEFALVFVTRQTELNRFARAMVKKAKGDAVLWFVYPKKSSKKYRCDFDRDRGWEELGKAGYEGVRMVAIDEDWSALRFRHVRYIKTIKREEKRVLSQEGKERLSKSKP